MEEKELINKLIEVLIFDISEEEKNMIQYVPMCSYKVTTKEKPLLLTFNLQSCIALFAYTNNFSFLAHMNMYKGNWYKDFEVNEFGDIIKCKRVEELYRELLNRKNEIKEPIKFGLILGISPLDSNYQSRVILERDLIELEKELKKEGFYTERTENFSSYSVILDGRNGKILSDNDSKNTNKNIGS